MAGGVQGGQSINLSFLKAFAISHTDEQDIVHVHNGKIGIDGRRSYSEWKNRTEMDKSKNCEARAAFLAALADSVGMRNDGNVGYRRGGVYLFNNSFFDTLKERLGADVYKALDVGWWDYSNKKGTLITGRPLTTRRISRVMTALSTELNRRDRRENVRLFPQNNERLECRTAAEIIAARYQTDQTAGNDWAAVKNVGKDNLRGILFKLYLGLDSVPPSCLALASLFDSKDLGSLRTVWNIVDTQADGLIKANPPLSLDRQNDCVRLDSSLNTCRDYLEELRALLKRPPLTSEITLGSIAEAIRTEQANNEKNEILSTGAKTLKHAFENICNALESKSLKKAFSPPSELTEDGVSLDKRKNALSKLMFSMSTVAQDSLKTAIEKAPNGSGPALLRLIKECVDGILQLAGDFFAREDTNLNKLAGFRRYLDLLSADEETVPAESGKMVFSNLSTTEEKFGKGILQLFGRLPEHSEGGKFWQEVKSHVNGEPTVLDCLKTLYCDIDFKKSNILAAALAIVLCDSFPSGVSLGKDEKDQLVQLARNSVSGKTNLNDAANAFCTSLLGLKNAVTIDVNVAAMILTRGLMAFRRMNETQFDHDVLLVGGGLGTVSEFTFTQENKTYVSCVTPRQQILHDFNVPGSLGIQPLTGLSKSELRFDNESLVSFLRFGVVGTTEANSTDHYRQLAVQVFLNNPKLVREAVEGDGEGNRTVSFPLYRTDLAANNDLGKGNDVIKPFDLTFVSGGRKVTVRLAPTVHHFHVPTDSVQTDKNRMISNVNQTTLLTKAETVRTLAALKALLLEAEKFTPRTPQIVALYEQLSDYGKTLEDRYRSGKEKINGFKNCGAEMQRFGARVTLLASLLGHVPAVNCNWGRDRTGAMDGEVKMLALKLSNGGRLAPIVLGEDPDVQLRTEMLHQTGNCDLARQVNCTSHPINLKQSVEGLELGLGKLFNMQTLADLEHRK